MGMLKILGKRKSLAYHCQILGQPGFQGFYTILEDKKMDIFQFPSNSCNILLKRSFWMIFYVLESSDSVFLVFQLSYFADVDLLVSNPNQGSNTEFNNDRLLSVST